MVDYTSAFVYKTRKYVSKSDTVTPADIRITYVFSKELKKSVTPIT
jgi:hypothetical protein